MSSVDIPLVMFHTAWRSEPCEYKWTDAESRAQKARLEAQRAEMQEELDDTVKEHIVNLRIDGLTDLSTKLQENYEKFVKDLAINIDSAVNLVSNSADNLTSVLG